MTAEFGSVRYNEHRPPRWIITCEPHVRARLKRVFPRAPQHAAEHLVLSDTPENCRDLIWFLDRYPMRVDRLELLADRARIHEDTSARVQELVAGRVPPLEITLAKPPRGYQLAVPQLLEATGGLLLADDVGLGKTVSSICAMMVPENLPAVVVCPAHLPRQWAGALAEFAPQLSVHIAQKGDPYEIKRVLRAGVTEKTKGFPDVFIVSYHKLCGWAETLAGAVRLSVFDEVQALRSGASTLIYRAAAHLAGHSRRQLGLSATPIYNYGSEFWNVIEVLRPGALGQRDEFLREWCTAGFTGSKARLASPEDFGGYLRREGIMLRRTRAEVGRELPALTKIVQDVESDASALKAINNSAVELARVILAANERYKGERMQASGKLDSLVRQATGIAKAPHVATFVRMLLESEQRIVLFGWHRNVYEIWRTLLADYSPVFYTGEESPTQKAAAVEAFTKGDSRVFIMSLRSGAGVDGLQGCCQVAVFGELDWSPGVHEQCAGRLHRDGQQLPCVAYFMVASDGADPIMVDVLGVKREQIDGVRAPDRALVERIDNGGEHIRRVARTYLASIGEVVND